MSFELIVAFTRLSDGRLGIGNKEKLPWEHNKKDMEHFKKLTDGKEIIVGRKTWDSIPKPFLNKKKVWVISRNEKLYNDQVDLNGNRKARDIEYINISGMKKEIEIATTKPRTNTNSKTDDTNTKTKKKQREFIVIGGTCVYNYFWNHVKTIHATLFTKVYECDTFFEFQTFNWVISEYKKHKDVLFLTYTQKQNFNEANYLNLLHVVNSKKEERLDRTGFGTKSIFGPNIKFDISESVPLLTTKKVGWKTVVHELLWFLNGDTDVTTLQKKNVNIWNMNTSREFLDSINKPDYPENELLYGYGHQIRKFGPDCVDQLKYIEDLLENDKYSRRIMWNVIIN
jgi:dihydrofolate reductase